MSAEGPTPDLLENVSDAIDTHLRAILAHDGRAGDRKMALKGHCRNRGMALQLLEVVRPQAELKTLLVHLFKIIHDNLITGGKNDRSKMNWRWEPSSKKLGRCETKWERNLMLAANGSPPNARWVNQIPTGSGLSPKPPKQSDDTSVWKGRKRAGNTGHIDLAYCEDTGRLIVIEFKLNADNPVSAAFQLVLYTLVLILAREEGLKIEDSRWRDAKRIDLRVLAPTNFDCAWHKQFYDRRYKLRWFEDCLNDAVASFGEMHGVELSFGFRTFDWASPPQSESEMLQCLDLPMKLVTDW